MTQAAVLDARERFLAEHARVAPGLPGAKAPWMLRARSAGLETFAQAGFPSTREEEWKYTSVAAIERHAFLASPRRVESASVAREAGAHFFAELAAYRLVFVDGRYSPGLSTAGTPPAGATLCSLGDVLERTPQRLEEYLTQTGQQTVFGRLNTAFMRDGAYVHLARGVVIDEPIHLLFLATAAGAAIHARNLIVAETGAHATIVEHYVGRDGAAYFTNAVTQIFTADGATVEHCKLQQEAADGFHIGAIHVAQHRDSRFVSHSIAFGAALARNDITTAFHAVGCSATLNGLYVAGGRQHVDHHTRIDHSQPGGTSREYYRGVLDGRSRGVFSGKVVVHPDAQRTDAQQLNHNLLLSEGAEIDTRPQLEIYADDVKCTHGATIGQLDDAQIFYLCSRGVEEATARTLLAYAFARDVIDRIRIAPVRARLAQVLLSRLPEGHRIRELA